MEEQVQNQEKTALLHQMVKSQAWEEVQVLSTKLCSQRRRESLRYLREGKFNEAMALCGEALGVESLMREVCKLASVEEVEDNPSY